MPNLRLANRYAKSLVDLAIERGQLEIVYADMKYLQAVCNVSKEFVNLLRSPVVQTDKKRAILKAITQDKVSELTALFDNLLVTKGREGELPEIANAVVDQYNEIKGIHKVKITTAQPISEELKASIVAKVKDSHHFETIELETKVNPELIGGFVLEFNNNQVDTTILRDLKDIKKSFSKNVYVKSM